MKSFEELRDRLSAHEVKRIVAVVASHDEHTLEAVVRARRENLVEPLLIGDAAKTEEILASLGEDASAYRIEDIGDGAQAAQRAADLAREGKVDCIMKGRIETGVLMKVMVNREHGIRKGGTMSLLAVMESPYYHKLFGITDVGLLTYPDKDQKKAALVNAVDAFHRLGVEMPKAALICAVEILSISYFAKGCRPLQLSFTQLVTVAVLALFTLIWHEPVRPTQWTLGLAICIGALAAIVSFVQFGIGWALKYVPAMKATLIYALEPVFAGIIGWLAGEHFGVSELTGAALIILAVLISAWRPGKRKDNGGDVL